MTKKQPDKEERPESTLGDLLLRTREAQNKTLEEAAKTTHITTTFLRALESNEYDKLPADVFVRGYIRIYASYLGLDSEDTLHHYFAQEKISPAPSVTNPYRPDDINSRIFDRTSIFIKKKSSKALPITILLAILILFYILGVFFRSKEQLPELKPKPDFSSSLIETLPQPGPKIPAVTTEVSSKEVAEQPGTTVKPTVIPPLKAPSQSKLRVTPETIISEKEPPLAAKAVEPATKPVAVSKSIEQIKPRSLPITVKVADKSVPPPRQPGQTVAPFKYVLNAQFLENTTLRIVVDSSPPLHYNPQSGTARTWKANENIVLDLYNRAGVSLTLNGKPLVIAGNDGSTATINIPADIPKSDHP
jgi:cytoskeleton protein RodZ